MKTMEECETIGCKGCTYCDNEYNPFWEWIQPFNIYSINKMRIPNED
ncbi:MAG: hypothetical protein ACXVI0_10095 [Halobacteriota archaeon]